MPLLALRCRPGFGGEGRLEPCFERLVDFVTRALADQLPLPETMRRLVHAILAYQHDQLQDDASALVAQWRPPPAPESP